MRRPCEECFRTRWRATWGIDVGRETTIFCERGYPDWKDVNGKQWKTGQTQLWLSWIQILAYMHLMKYQNYKWPEIEKKIRSYGTALFFLISSFQRQKTLRYGKLQVWPLYTKTTTGLYRKCLASADSASAHDFILQGSRNDMFNLISRKLTIPSILPGRLWMNESTSGLLKFYLIWHKTEPRSSHIVIQRESITVGAVW